MTDAQFKEYALLKEKKAQLTTQLDALDARDSNKEKITNTGWLQLSHGDNTWCKTVLHSGEIMDEVVKIMKRGLRQELKAIIEAMEAL